MLLTNANRLVSISTETGAELRTFATSNRIFGTPTAIGGELIVGEGTSDGRAGGPALVVRERQTSEALWSFVVAPRTTLFDFVHTGDRIYVATSDGLVCIVDEPGAKPVPLGYAFGPGATVADAASVRSQIDKRTRRPAAK